MRKFIETYSLFCFHFLLPNCSRERVGRGAGWQVEDSELEREYQDNTSPCQGLLYTNHITEAI